MAAGKDLATYTIEPTNEWAGTSGYEARKKYRDTDSVTHYSSASTMFQTIFDDLGLSPGIGGLVYLKNGLYSLDTNVNGGNDVIDLSTDTADYGAGVQIDVTGENVNNVIIRNAVAGTDDNVMGSHCTSRWQNITFDGNNVGTDMTLLYAGHGSNDGRSLFVDNCKFTGANGADIMTLTTDHVMVTNSIFENSQAGSNDMIAFEATKSGYIGGNTFNRQIGDDTGSCVSSGGCSNTVIANNRVLKAGGDDHGISMEAYTINYENVTISNNLVVNGKISVGGTGAYSVTFRRMNISNNLLYGSTIHVLGPSSGDKTTQIKDVTVENNQIFDAWRGGIKVINTAGFTTVRNNTIKNSNLGSNSSTFDKGLIYIADATDVICENNRLIMEANADTDINPYGIRYSDVTNAIIRGNRILNRNATNPSYTTTGAVTTSSISRSL